MFELKIIKQSFRILSIFPNILYRGCTIQIYQCYNSFELGKDPQYLLKRKRKAWVAQLCCAQETGKPDSAGSAEFGQLEVPGSRPFK